MKNKDVAVRAFLNFLYLLVGCVSAELFTILALRFAVLFVELDFAAASMIRLVILFTVSSGLWIFFSYKDGYQSASFTPGEAVPAAFLATMIHFLIGIPLNFTPWAFGATRHIAGFLSLGSAYNSTERIAEIPRAWSIGVGLVTALFLAGVGLLGNYIGFRKRLRDRNALTGETNLK